MSKIIGIDLGTTNSCVSVIEGGEPKVITNAEGARTTPSVVSFQKDGSRSVGIVAKRQAIIHPKHTVSSIKRFMGRRYDEVKEEMHIAAFEVTKGVNDLAAVKIDDKSFTPPEVSAMVLTKMKETAEEYLGEKVEEAVITVPAYFNDAQRQATKDAGEIAGLKVRRIINEPTAAALAYGVEKKEEKLIAVYDFGGGTFDISILELSGGVYEVKSTKGDTHLGGDNIDQVIVEWLINEFKKQEGVDISKDAMAIQRLKEAAEKAKIELSTTTNAEINLPFLTADQTGPKHLVLSLSRDKFNSMIEGLIKRTITPCRDAVNDAKVALSEIDEVILVGGSTRIPAVQKAVEEFFGKAPNKTVNPDEAVAMGAAIQAGILGGDENLKDILLLDVTPLSLGIETLGGVMTKLIEKNTTIPVKRSQVFSTAADNQPAVNIHVLQGERDMAIHNRTLGRFDLVDIPPAPRGMPQIEVTFDIDANGIMHVSAKDLGTGKEQKIRIETSSGLSEAEIEKMKKEAEKFAEEDKKFKEKIEAKNKLDGLIFSTEKSLKEYGDKLEDADKKTIEDAVAEAKKELESEDKEKLEAAFNTLQEKAVKLGEIIYKEAQAQQAQQQAQSQGGPQQQAQQEPAGDQGAGESVDADYEVVDDE